MEDSEPAEDGLLAGLRWNRSARDQAQLKHKIRDLPGLLKHGLHLRKKSVSISSAPTADRVTDCASFRVFTSDGHNRSLIHGFFFLVYVCMYVCVRARVTVLCREPVS